MRSMEVSIAHAELASHQIARHLERFRLVECLEELSEMLSAIGVPNARLSGASRR